MTNQTSPLRALQLDDLEHATGGASRGPITNPWNPGFWTQGMGGGGGFHAPLSGNVTQSPTICMPGSTCNFTIQRAPRRR